jgi:hypothetical protein
MPNGKPADHPLTDILHWGLPGFDLGVDELIREIDALGGRHDLDSIAEELLAVQDKLWQLKSTLEQLKKRLIDERRTTDPDRGRAG